MHCWAVSYFLHELTQTWVKEKQREDKGLGHRMFTSTPQKNNPRGKTEVYKEPTVNGLLTLGISYFWTVCFWHVTLRNKPLMVYVWPNVHEELNLRLEYQKWWISVDELAWSEIKAAGSLFRILYIWPFSLVSPRSPKRQPLPTLCPLVLVLCEMCPEKGARSRLRRFMGRAIVVFLASASLHSWRTCKFQDQALCSQPVDWWWDDMQYCQSPGRFM